MILNVVWNNENGTNALNKDMLKLFYRIVVLSLYIKRDRFTIVLGFFCRNNPSNKVLPNFFYLKIMKISSKNNVLRQKHI